MTIQDKLIAKYGNPMAGPNARIEFEKKHMCVYSYPIEIKKAIPVLGPTLYCNKDFVEPYEKALKYLISQGLEGEINENDQCFMPRYQRGSKTMISIHTWAIAIDLNPTNNPIFSTRQQCVDKKLKPFTEKFIQAWRTCGFICGADFKGRPDLMHFEWTKEYCK